VQEKDLPSATMLDEPRQQKQEAVKELVEPTRGMKTIDVYNNKVVKAISIR
jgi:hypothetical protein